MEDTPFNESMPAHHSTSIEKLDLRTYYFVVNKHYLISLIHTCIAFLFQDCLLIIALSLPYLFSYFILNGLERVIRLLILPKRNYVSNLFCLMCLFCSKWAGAVLCLVSAWVTICYASLGHVTCLPGSRVAFKPNYGFSGPSHSLLISVVLLML